MILPIKKELIPYRFDTEMNGVLYTFEIHYNSEYDFFTMDLFVNDDVQMYGEKLVYNQPIFQSLTDERLPEIVPIDPSNKENKITYSNFADTVVLKVSADAV